VESVDDSGSMLECLLSGWNDLYTASALLCFASFCFCSLFFLAEEIFPSARGIYRAILLNIPSQRKGREREREWDWDFFFFSTIILKLQRSRNETTKRPFDERSVFIASLLPFNFFFF